MGNEEQPESKEIPSGQIWFDRIFLWFVVSLLITGVMYTVWGLYQVFNLPPAP